MNKILFFTQEEIQKAVFLQIIHDALTSAGRDYIQKVQYSRDQRTPDLPG
jgi:hypothetical protein